MTTIHDGDLLHRAQRHLARRDPVLRQLIRKLGACGLRPHPHRFQVLVKSIVWQQLSTRAAETIHGRLLGQLPRRRMTAKGIHGLSEPELRRAGLSAAKARALRDLAARVCDRSLPLGQLHRLEDEAVIEALIVVWGIGRWTAQMFLMFCLGRPDVLPVDDLGLRAGVQRSYGLAELPKRTALEALAECWRPYRSVATWYLWRSLGGNPPNAGD